MTIKKNEFRSTLLPLVIIPVGGLLTLGLCYLLYFLIYNFVESRFFPTDPTSVPAAIIRSAFSLSILVLYLALLRTKMDDLIKATILVGPMVMLVTTTFLTLYENPAFAIVAITIIAAICFSLFYRLKVRWFYYYAAVITVLTLIFLAYSGA